MVKNTDIFTNAKRILLSCALVVLALAFMAGCSRDSEEPIDSGDSIDSSDSTYRGNLNTNPSDSVNPVASSSPVGSSNSATAANFEDVVVAWVNGIAIYASDVQIHIPHVEEMKVWDYFIMFSEFEIDHDREFSPGVTFGRAIKEEAVRVAAFSKLYEYHARLLEIRITDEEQEMIDAEIYRLIEHFGEQELNELLRADGFRGHEHLAELYVSQFILENLILAIVADPEEFAGFEQYMPEEEVIPELLGAKHILAHFDNFATEEEAESYANELLARALAGEDFDMLVREHGQDPGMSTFVNGYSFTVGVMAPEFEQATIGLEMGEISGLVRTGFGFHIIKRVEPNVYDWHFMNNTQPRTLENRMMEAVFRGFEAMADDADIEFLPALDDIVVGQLS